MKILLISANVCIDPYPVYPLGVSVVAGALQTAGHAPEQFDILVSGSDGLQARLKREKFGLIGVSLRNVDLVNSAAQNDEILRVPLEIVRVCREAGNTPIVLGGAGFSLFPEELMRRTGADYGVVGEGEDAMIELADTLERGEKPAAALIRGGRGAQSPALYDTEILDWYYKKTHLISMQTKRGCPCDCVYCTYPGLEGAAIRRANWLKIINQIAELRSRYPEAMFFFVDSIFNDPAGHYKEFLRLLNARCGRVPFDCFTTPWNLADADIDFLVDCGMISTDLGIDATCDETLRGMGKNFTFAEAGHCVKYLQRKYVGVSCSVMFGGPGETPETLRLGIENLHHLEPAVVAVFAGVRILPGTELYAIARREGKIPADWNGTDSLYYYADGLTPQLLHETLLAEFGGNDYCAYPPDRLNKRIRSIHKIGYLNFRKFMGEPV